MIVSRHRTAVATLAALVWAAAGTARAEVKAQFQPSYASSTGTTRDETGLETGFDASQWVQRYRLTLDQRLYPTLAVSGGGNLVWTSATSVPTGAPRSELDARQWNTYARLSAGGPDLNGGLDYNRSWDDAETRSGGVTNESPGSVRESFAAAAVWRPSDLPAMTLRLARANAYDAAREVLDQTSDEALLSVRHEPVKDLLLSYSLRYGTSTNHLTDLVRSELSNSAEASWSTPYLAGRGNVYVSYRIAARASNTSAALPGAEVAIQQLPEEGYSKVEDRTADTPERVELNVNRALVNGDLRTSAGINLGTLAGEGLVVPPRDLGARFQDVITPVNEIHVYVDRSLPADLADDFPWVVYQSSDNRDWVRVDQPEAARFNSVLLRFEVPIPVTQARYLKVVTTPLRPAATTDDRYREIFVTEVQFFEVIPAELVRGRDSDVAGSLSGTTRVLLVRDLGLAYDFSGFLSHAGGRGPTWSVANGLSLNRRLDPVFAVAARVERSDADAGAGRQGQNRWSASLSADPLPTLGALLSYSGQLAQLPGGTSISNSGTFSARADLYEGLALGGLASLSWARTETGVTSRGMLLTASTSIIPNRVVSLTGSVSYSDSRQSGGAQERTEQRGAVEGSASVTPFPALALSGSVIRQFGGSGGAATLASFSGAFSPFRGGDLQLRYSYQETLDVDEGRRTRAHGPGARWNIRPGWHADVAWAAQDTRSPTTTDRVRSLNANLLITFR
jgi:hypothetical protein